jgi:hypothetical protein
MYRISRLLFVRQAILEEYAQEPFKNVIVIDIS